MVVIVIGTHFSSVSVYICVSSPLLSITMGSLLYKKSNYHFHLNVDEKQISW